MEIKKVAIIGLGALGILFGNQIVKRIGDDLTVIADARGLIAIGVTGSSAMVKPATLTIKPQNRPKSSIWSFLRLK